MFKSIRWYAPKGMYALAIGLGAVVIAALPQQRIGAQTVIRDGRATDTTVTPALGRGFSLATNTYQSTCLGSVKITEPSYDFDFFLEEDTQASESNATWKSSNTSSSSYSDTSRVFGWSHNVGSSRNSSTSNTGASSNQKQTRFLQARLVVSTYYASVDESNSPLSRAALELLSGDDAPGFFAACGTYYVKGITRRAEYKARFVFETESEESAQSMFSSIRSRVSSSYGYKWWGANQKRDNTRTSESSFNDQSSNKFQSSNLKIFINGIGMGKDRDAALIVSTFEEYREALKKAFIAMQAPETGRVTAVELGAWAENAQFQSRLRMRETDVVGKGRRRIPLYKKKDILTFNAEFIAELNRSLRQRQGTYYLARECRNQIRSLLSEDPEKQAKRRVLNLITQKPGVTLGEMNGVLTQEVVDNLFNEDYMMFLSGKKSEPVDGGNFWDKQEAPAEPASYEGCIDSILSGREQVPQDDKTDANIAEETRMNKRTDAARQVRLAGKGLYLRRWNTYDGCRKIQQFFVSPPIPLLRLYCMPMLTDEYQKVTENQSGDTLKSLLERQEVKE